MKKERRRGAEKAVIAVLLIALIITMISVLLIMRRKAEADNWVIPAAEENTDTSEMSVSHGDSVKTQDSVSYETGPDAIHEGGINLIKANADVKREDTYRQSDGGILTAEPVTEEPEGVKATWRGNSPDSDNVDDFLNGNNKVYSPQNTVSGNDARGEKAPDTDRVYDGSPSGQKIKISFDWNLNADQELKAKTPGTLPYPFPQSEEGEDGLPYIKDSIICTEGSAYGDGVGKKGTGIYNWPDIPYDSKVYGYYFRGWAEGSPDGTQVTEYSTVEGGNTSRTLYAMWVTSPYSDYMINHWVQIADKPFSDKGNIETDPERKWRVGESSGSFILSCITVDSAKTGSKVQPKSRSIEGYSAPAGYSQYVREPMEDGASTVFNYFYGIDEDYFLSMPGPDSVSMNEIY